MQNGGQVDNVIADAADTKHPAHTSTMAARLWMWWQLCKISWAQVEDKDLSSSPAFC